MSILELQGIEYSYEKNSKPVFTNLSLTFEKGRIYAVTGKSGVGKTTLLSLISGLTSPTKGRILYNGSDIAGLDRFSYRSRMVGVVFQNYNLLPQLTAEENVALSLDVSGKGGGRSKDKAMEVLRKVEITDDKAKRRILKLSGGEQQRVAIARALCFDPDIILADEPTGNLDGETQQEVLGIFKKLAHEDNRCVIIVTHSPEVSRNVDVVFELSAAN